MTQKSTIHNLTSISGVLAAFGVVILFSSFILVSRLGFVSALSISEMAAIRFITAGTLMTPVLVFLWPIEIKLGQAVSLALLGGIGFALLAFTGFKLAPAAHGSVLLHGTLPLFSFFFATLSDRSKSTLAQRYGLVAIAAGIGAMASESFAHATLDQMVGDGALLLASAFWSAYGIYVKRVGISPIAASAVVAVISMLIFTPMYWFFSNKTLFVHTWNDIGLQVIFQGLLIGTLSIFLYTSAISKLGPVRISTFTATVPCITTILAVPLLGEDVTLFAACGVAAVTFGVVLSLRR